MAFSPESKRLATGGQDRTIKIWNTATGKLLATLEGHTGGITYLAPQYEPPVTEAVDLLQVLPNRAWTNSK
jgi:WD40 repeat protein